MPRLGYGHGRLIVRRCYVPRLESIGEVCNDSNGHPWKRISVFPGDTYLETLPPGTRVYAEPQVEELKQYALTCEKYTDNTWIPIELAPFAIDAYKRDKWLEPCLLLVNGVAVQGICSASHWLYKDSESNVYKELLNDPTHWMPLPIVLKDINLDDNG